jgi:hypothetical protein
LCADCWLPCVFCKCPYWCCHVFFSGQIEPSSAAIASGYIWPQQISTNGNPEVGFFAHVDSLNLQTGLWFVDIINLAKFVNPQLKNKPLAKFPLSDLGVNISQIQKRVTVSSIRFLDEPGVLPISITIDVEPKPTFRFFSR